MNANMFIEPERQGLWITAGFIVALVALVMSSVALYQLKVVVLGTQTEVLMLNKKIEQMKTDQAKAAPAAQPAPPAPAETK
jgi:hypothetical protein